MKDRFTHTMVLADKTLSTLTLDKMPIFDGMAAADGKLFMSMSDGSLCCFAE